MTVKIVSLAGKRWAIMPEKDYRRLSTAAARKSGLPPLPRPDADGNLPAVEYARVSLARKIINARHRAGLSQAALARLAGIRPETLNRIEKGKSSPDTSTILKLDRALSSARTSSRSQA